MPSLLLGTMAAYIALSIGATELSKFLSANIADLEMWPGSPWAYPPLYVDFLPIQALQVLRYLLEAWITAPMEIAIYRFVLLNESTPRFSPFSAMVRRYAAWTFAASMLLMVADQIKFLSEPWSSLYILALILILSVFAWLSLFACTLAIDEAPLRWAARVRMAARQIRGQVWLLVRTMLLVLIPLFLFFAVYSIRTWDESLPDQAARLLSWRYRFVEAFFMASYYLPATTAVAWIYAWAVKSEGTHSRP